MINRKLHILVLCLSIVFTITACLKDYEDLTFQEMKASMPEALDETLIEKHLILSGGWVKLPVSDFSFTNMTHLFPDGNSTVYDTLVCINLFLGTGGGGGFYIYSEVVPVSPNGQIKFTLPLIYDPFLGPNGVVGKSVNQVGIKLLCSDSIFVLRNDSLLGKEMIKDVIFDIYLNTEIYDKIFKTCYEIPFEVFAIRQNNDIVCISFATVWLKNVAEGDPACFNEPRMEYLAPVDPMIPGCESTGFRCY